MEEDWCAGTLSQDNGKFGFIQQDGGGDMFVMPMQCEAFGGVLPPIGTRVLYVVVPDPKTQRPRAEHVQPEELEMTTAEYAQIEAELQMPAEDVQPKPSLQPAPRYRPASKMAAPGVCTGTVAQVSGKFGFIKQDSDDPDLFVMPMQCVGFGGVLPLVGTRVTYSVGADPKKGQPIAEDVYPEESAQPAPRKGWGTGNASLARPGPGSGAKFGMGSGPAMCAGTIVKGNGRFGFIQQDSGDKDLFVMPAQCTGFGGALPPIGTRVAYVVGVDPKKGQPTAEDVQPEENWTVPVRRQVASNQRGGPYAMQADSYQWSISTGWSAAAGGVPHAWPAAMGGELFGTMLHHQNNGKFGFIKQDHVGEDTFVMPMQCQAFGGALPVEGARVAFVVATDPKSGRPRAEEVRPEHSGGVSYGGKSGFGKGWSTH